MLVNRIQTRKTVVKHLSPTNYVVHLTLVRTRVSVCGYDVLQRLKGGAWTNDQKKYWATFVSLDLYGKCSVLRY